jgi:hypothetical protein
MGPKFDGMKTDLDQLRTCLNTVYTVHCVRAHQHVMHLLSTSRDITFYQQVGTSVTVN